MVKYGNCSWIISRKGLKNVMLTQEERGVKRGCEKKKVDDGTRDVLF